MSIIACSENGCTAKAVARGVCSNHYRALMKEMHPCSFQGCKNGRVFLDTGYCGTHQNRLRKHGDPSVTMKGKAHKVQYTSDGLRICKACSVAKPETSFHRDRRGTNGYRSKCIDCTTRRERERYESKRDEIVEQARQYRSNNREVIRGREAARYKRDRDKRIELATKHSHIRRARISGSDFDKGLTRLSLRKRDGDKCHYCKRTMDFKRAVGRVFHGLHATIEHIVPISDGGTHTFDNCVLACRDCNLTKNAKSLEEFVRFIEPENSPTGQMMMFDLLTQ